MSETVPKWRTIARIGEFLAMWLPVVSKLALFSTCRHLDQGRNNTVSDFLNARRPFGSSWQVGLNNCTCINCIDVKKTMGFWDLNYPECFITKFCSTDTESEISASSSKAAWIVSCLICSGTGTCSLGKWNSRFICNCRKMLPLHPTVLELLQFKLTKGIIDRRNR